MAAVEILKARPGLTTRELIQALGLVGEFAHVVTQLHRDGRREGFGQASDGYWWAQGANAEVDECLAAQRVTPGHRRFWDWQCVHATLCPRDAQAIDWFEHELIS